MFKIKKKTKVNDKLELIYEFKGQRYYSFKNPIENLPAKRAVVAELKAREADMIMDKELLLTYIDKATEALNKGKIAEVAVVLNEIKIRTSLITEETVLLNLAACYVLKEGEDIYEVDFNKVAEWKKDAAMLSFFLGLAKQTIDKFSNISPSDLENYLTESRELLDRLNKYTGLYRSNDTK